MGKTPNLLKFEIDDVADKKTTQTGIYQSDLLCAECDNEIGRYDKYAYEVLAHEIDQQKLKSPFGRGLEVYEIGKIRVGIFRMFLVSLVWRAGIARDPMFQLVKLGKYEDRLKQILLGDETKLLDAISAVIVLFRPPKYPNIMWSPFRSKMDGINMVTFYLPPWKLLLKLDQRPFNSPFDKFALSAEKPAYAVVQGFWSKGEFKLLCDFHRKSRKAAGFE